MRALHTPLARRQRGIALLTAIILVAIATVVATAIAWQSQLSARRGIAVFTVAQSLALAEGAEAMAGYLLNQSRAQNPTVVSPSQQWALPRGPLEIAPGAVLEAVMDDQAGKFNLNNVVTRAVANGPLVEDKNGRKEFEFLLQTLNIDPKYAALLVDWLDTDNQPVFPGGAEDAFYMALDPPYRPPNMLITNVSELLAMGMDRASYDKLKGLITALPSGTKLNVCTAPGLVLDALAGSVSFSSLTAQQLAAQRAQNTCFPDPNAFANTLPADQKSVVQGLLATTSNYFRLRTWITIGTTRFTLYSLMEVSPSGGQIRPIFRTFGTE